MIAEAVAAGVSLDDIDEMSLPFLVSVIEASRTRLAILKPRV